MKCPPVRWRIEPLDGERHQRAGFSCGAPELDRYIRDLATQDIRRDIARVFVALDENAPVVVGFYALSVTSIDKSGLPPSQARKLPHYPVPAALIARLAVDEQSQGQGLGEHLLMDALVRIVLAGQTVAMHAVAVDARDEAAGRFYRKYGFIPLSAEPRRLFLPLATIRSFAAT